MDNPQTSNPFLTWCFASAHESFIAACMSVDSRHAAKLCGDLVGLVHCGFEQEPGQDIDSPGLKPSDLIDTVYSTHKAPVPQQVDRQAEQKRQEYQKGDAADSDEQSVDNFYHIFSPLCYTKYANTAHTFYHGAASSPYASIVLGIGSHIQLAQTIDIVAQRIARHKHTVARLHEPKRQTVIATRSV